MNVPWPFSEDGAWDGKTWRWRSDGITVEQATALTRLAPTWTWTVRPDRRGGFTFSLTRGRAA